MKRTAFLSVAIVAAASLAFTAGAFAQAAPSERVKLDVTMQDLQVLGQGLGKLPYETAAPVMVELQKQLQAHQDEKRKAEEAAIKAVNGKPVTATGADEAAKLPSTN
jgi:hypothetical protein